MNIQIPKYASKKSEELLRAFSIRIATIEGLEKKVAQRADALRIAQDTFRDDPSDENLDALVQAKSEHSLVHAAIPATGVHDAAAIRARYLETPEFFNAIREDLEKLQDQFTTAISKARKEFAQKLTDRIIKGLPHDHFDHREPTGEAADTALRRLQALERRGVALAGAHTAARQRSTGSQSAMNTETILSYLSATPEDLK